jgi:hypothetical protein
MPKYAIDVAVGGKADMPCALQMSAFDPKRTLRACQECAKMKGGNLATVGSCYFTQSINGTAGRFGQFMTPVKESDN